MFNKTKNVTLQQLFGITLQVGHRYAGYAQPQASSITKFSSKETSCSGDKLADVQANPLKCRATLRRPGKPSRQTLSCSGQIMHH